MSTKAKKDRPRKSRYDQRDAVLLLVQKMGQGQDVSKLKAECDNLKINQCIPDPQRSEGTPPTATTILREQTAVTVHGAARLHILKLPGQAVRQTAWPSRAHVPSAARTI